jgi:competence protein ComEC
LSGAQKRSLTESPSGAWRPLALLQLQPLLPLAIAAVVGILAQSSLPWCSAGMWIVLAVAVLLLTPMLPQRLRWIAAVAVFVPAFALRHIQDEATFRSVSILTVTTPTAQPSVIEGTIDTPVILRPQPLAEQRGGSPWQTQVEMSVDRMRVGYRFQSCSGRLLVSGDGKWDNLRPGDQIRVFGSLRQFSPPTNPGQRDLRTFYRRRHLHGRVRVSGEDQIVVLDNSVSVVSRWIASIAAAGRESLLRHTGESTGPLAVALVIGQRDFVDSRMRDQLLVTGTAHLLSVSGLHLAIVALLARWIAMMLPLPRAMRIMLVIGICILYTAITGARPPVVRAAVLVVAVMLSIGIRRPCQPINTLALAAIVLVTYNPQLVFSVGVQLSFLAVATLLICGRPSRQCKSVAEPTVESQRSLQALIENSYAWPVRWLRRGWAVIRQLTWFSLCVTVTSMPLVWHQFHVVSPISVITNVVLGPMLFVALGSGVATIASGWIADPLAIVPGYICDRSLWLMESTIEAAASIPYGHFWLPSPPTWMVIAFYTLLMASLVWSRRGGFTLRCTGIACWSLAAYLVATSPAELPRGSLEATFVDVGHGTSVVLRLGGDEVWLYDCGRLGNDVGSSRDIDATLWSMGVTQLDGIFLSHADADHYNALPGLLRRFGAAQIITPPGMLREPEGGLAAIRRAIDDTAVPLRELSAGDVIGSYRWKAAILHPPAAGVAASDNANSLVVRIDHQGTSLLLPGDLEPPGTQILVNQPRPPPGGVLMAPHHGSLAMESESILQWGRPSETIVSGGQRARRPEVREILAITGSGVHVTANLGAIRVRIEPAGKIRVRSWLGSPW